MTSTAEAHSPDNAKGKTFLIRIDRARYHVSEKHLTGRELRKLGGLGDDVDLYLEVDSADDDKLIGDEEKIRMQNGLDFFSTPRNITPGHE